MFWKSPCLRIGADSCSFTATAFQAPCAFSAQPERHSCFFL